MQTYDFPCKLHAVDSEKPSYLLLLGQYLNNFNLTSPLKLTFHKNHNFFNFPPKHSFSGKFS